MKNLKVKCLEITWFDDSKTLVNYIKMSDIFWCDGQLAIDITFPEGDTETFKEIKSVRRIEQ